MTANTDPAMIAMGHEHRGAKTGFVTLTMPVQHERLCDDCGERFWSIPIRFGEDYRTILKETTSDQS
jgi:hypothetical protein